MEPECGNRFEEKVDNCLTPSIQTVLNLEIGVAKFFGTKNSIIMIIFYEGSGFADLSPWFEAPPEEMCPLH